MSGQFATGAEVSYGHFGTSAEMSLVQSVLGPKCLDTVTGTITESSTGRATGLTHYPPTDSKLMTYRLLPPNAR